MGVRPMRATIQLFGGRTAVIDAVDFERVNAHRWYGKQDGTVYRAYRHKPFWSRMYWVTEYLECFVLGLDVPQAPVHFVDGDHLHCWRDNLKAI